MELKGKPGRARTSDVIGQPAALKLALVRDKRKQGTLSPTFGPMFQAAILLLSCEI